MQHPLSLLTRASSAYSQYVCLNIRKRFCNPQRQLVDNDLLWNNLKYANIVAMNMKSNKHRSQVCTWSCLGRRCPRDHQCGTYVSTDWWCDSSLAHLLLRPLPASAIFSLTPLVFQELDLSFCSMILSLRIDSGIKFSVFSTYYHFRSWSIMIAHDPSRPTMVHHDQ